ncbi:MAG: hypothetical protein M0R06_04470 [Sphaerochaeta sp.]|jgi:hypothetical protein|nr:hypothetical protein [Sphaerochaeta sp.]
MTDANIVQMDNEIIGQNLIAVYNYRIEHPHSTVKDAAAALGLSYQTVLTWLQENRFADYIAEIHDPRSDLAQATALNSLPGIVESMAKIATGKLVLRGGNPQAAAEFVLKVAQLGAHFEPRQTGNATQVNVYVPEMNVGGEPKAHPATVIDV